MSPRPVRSKPSRWLFASLGAAVLGSVALAVGAAYDAPRAMHSYLAAYAFVLSLALGALILLAIVHTINAGWPVAIRRLIETVVGLIPLLALLLIPILVGMKALYPWLRPESFTDSHTRHLVEHRLAYLNVPFFLARAGVIFGAWSAFAVLLRRWSLRQDTQPQASADLQVRMRRLSAWSLPVLGLTLTVASFDWLMSLNPEWYTSMYGVYFFAGGFLGANALVTLATFAADRRGAIPALRASHYYALGRLLLAFTIFWAYIAYFQFFLTWIGNKPTEATWYLERMRAGWGGVSVFLAIGHFAVPFLLLLPYAIKWRRVWLAPIAAWILIVHYVDCYWLVLPALRLGLSVSWHDLAGLLAVGGTSLAFGLWTAARHPLVAQGDPRLAVALAYDSH